MKDRVIVAKLIKIELKELGFESSVTSKNVGPLQSSVYVVVYNQNREILPDLNRRFDKYREYGFDVFSNSTFYRGNPDNLPRVTYLHIKVENK